MKRATNWGSERSSQLELTAHLGSLYNYGRVDIYIPIYDYREGFQVGLSGSVCIVGGLSCSNQTHRSMTDKPVLV